MDLTLPHLPGKTLAQSLAAWPIRSPRAQPRAPAVLVSVPAAPTAQRNPSGLAVSLLASLALHVGLAVAVSATLSFEAIGDTRSKPLTATLVPPQATTQPPLLAQNGTRAPVQEPQPQRPVLPMQPGPEDVSTRQARFLVDPDLSILEQIPTTVPGAISLKLYVTAQGTVEKVSVVRADPVPQALLDGLVERFGAAKLSPATADNKPRPSTIDVTIRVDPGVHLLEPDRQN